MKKTWTLAAGLAAGLAMLGACETTYPTRDTMELAGTVNADLRASDTRQAELAAMLDQRRPLTAESYAAAMDLAAARAALAEDLASLAATLTAEAEAATAAGNPAHQAVRALTLAATYAIQLSDTAHIPAAAQAVASLPPAGQDCFGAPPEGIDSDWNSDPACYGLVAARRAKALCEGDVAARGREDDCGANRFMQARALLQASYAYFTAAALPEERAQALAPGLALEAANARLTALPDAAEWQRHTAHARRLEGELAVIAAGSEAIEQVAFGGAGNAAIEADARAENLKAALCTLADVGTRPRLITQGADTEIPVAFTTSYAAAMAHAADILGAAPNTPEDIAQCETRPDAYRQLCLDNRRWLRLQQGPCGLGTALEMAALDQP